MTTPLTPYAPFGRLLAHHRGTRLQGDVADLLDISRATLSQIERGHVLPTGRTLARLLCLYQNDKAAPPASRAQLAEIMDALILAGGAS